MSLHQDGPCLRYPENLGLHPTITHEVAVSMLLRATQLAQTTPFTWGYIDKPSEGQLFLVFITQQQPILQDGLRYQEQEQRYVLPAGPGRELEVMETKFGFIPGQDSVAFRMRRRYRLHKGGHPQLMLIHYLRGQNVPIVPSLNQPARVYPLRPLNEPSIFVMGEKMGQKVFTGSGGSAPPGERQQSLPPPMAAMNMNFGVGMSGNAQALLAAQNSNMEALERRSQRDRSGSMSTRQTQLPPSRTEDEDSADESDLISTRALALTRYKRNHELMNEVFMYAAFSKLKDNAPRAPPYSIFNKDELEEKAAKLAAEIDVLKAKAASRQEARLRAEASSGPDDAGDVSMTIDPPNAAEGIMV
ncbi:predicted protein [Sparassis crispa]|uniref:SWI/SNF and RSC complexes subunit Ssr4 N-terminal domain-containing protein n=1 Tax=Sparassis crispa TaxID=139825 RepID=A0A401GT57_9APHY|nr:predicted protein [Sparassis crispa]GBE85421.1 predicted protein [Sparassis crispa]